MARAVQVEHEEADRDVQEFSRDLMAVDLEGGGWLVSGGWRVWRGG